MDQFEGRCWLDWWANGSTLLGSIEVSVSITADGNGWQAHGNLMNVKADCEEFEFLCDLDPVFSLRFDDDSTVIVNVRTAEAHGPFELTEYTEPVARQFRHGIDL